MYFKYRNQKIYYEKYGNGNNSIVILPGWGDVFPTFLFIINFFIDSFTIYYIHYPGFGKSPNLNCSFSIIDYAQLVLQFFYNMKIINPIIIAHSFGGRIASILLGKYKYNCNKLILIDVAGIKHFSLYLFLKRISYKLLKKTSILLPCCLRNKYINYLRVIYSSSDYNLLPDSMKKTFQNIVNKDLREYYSSINCDTLIIWGNKDKDTPLKDAYYLHKKIKSSGLIIYPNCGHFSYYEKSYLTLKILHSYIKK